MKTILATLALVILAVCCAHAVLPQAKPAAESENTAVQAVLAANARLNEFANRLETDAFFAGIVPSDETRIIQDGRLFKTRAEAIATVRQGAQGVARVERRFDDPHVTLLAPDAALLTADGLATVTLADGRGITTPFAASLVFVRRDGRWLLFHGHYSVPNPR